MAAPLHTVLVADDDETFRLQIKLGLAPTGARVIEASSAAQALELARAERPELALIDLMMEHPDSGFVLAWELSRLTPRPAVIIITAVSSRTGMDFDAATRADRRWVHADAVLTKPIRFEQLEQRIEAALAARAG